MIETVFFFYQAGVGEQDDNRVYVRLGRASHPHQKPRTIIEKVVHLYREGKFGGSDSTNWTLKSIRLSLYKRMCRISGFKLLFFITKLYSTEKSNKYSNGMMCFDEDDVS